MLSSNAITSHTEIGKKNIIITISTINIEVASEAEGGASSHLAYPVGTLVVVGEGTQPEG